MTKGKRFFIFLSSAGIMTLFLLFTLSVRQDKPFEKYMEWTPGNRVISLVTEMKDAEGNSRQKSIDLMEGVQDSLTQHLISKEELIHSINKADIEFFHQLTLPRQRPKQYYALVEIHDVEYGVLLHTNTKYSEIVGFGLPIVNTSNVIYLVYSGSILFCVIAFLLFRKLFKRIKD